MNDGRLVTVLPNPDAVAQATADRFVRAAEGAIAERGIFRVALSGGSTPKDVYPLIAATERRDEVDWSRVEFFWGDERAVPPDDPESNFGVAYQMLIARLPRVRQDRIHRMQADAPDLDAAALAYEAELRLAFDAAGATPPAFDLIWLGMGPDGHTASLFPGSTAIAERERWVVGTWAPAPQAWRMTFTYPLLNAGRDVIFVVTGADKADPLGRILAGGSGLPAEDVRGSSVEWIVDAAAASRAGQSGPSGSD
jgi:6-phosphogluconolactonase